jgi:hypothetical protein
MHLRSRIQTLLHLKARIEHMKAIEQATLTERSAPMSRRSRCSSLSSFLHGVGSLSLPSEREQMISEQHLLTLSEVSIIQTLLTDYRLHEEVLSAMTGQSLEKCRERGCRDWKRPSHSKRKKTTMGICTVL